MVAYQVSATLTINQHLTRIAGNNATLNYTGSGAAVEVGPLPNGYYVVSCAIERLGVVLNSGSVAWRTKASHTTFLRVSALPRRRRCRCN